MQRSRSIRLGVVQPHTRVGAQAPSNLDRALRYVEEAAGDGIDLLVFPETYPGPAQAVDRFDVLEPLSRAARDNGIDLVAGTTIETEGGHHISELVIDRTGTLKGAYHRSHPRAEIYYGLYSGGPFWDIRYQPGDALPVFDMGWGILGVGVCSEVFVPEVARGLALKGAEVCVFPTGIMIED
ncbi:MAG: carbon-nitrogen hydrolase family protein, partial [Solirubrobacteraceae bacterium]